MASIGAAPTAVDEFAGLRPPRRRPSWVALAVVVFSGFLIFHQRNDVVYALTSGSPRLLGEPAGLFKPGAAVLPENRYVRITGTPDFESAVILDTQGEWKFRSFFRVLETNRRLFVQRASGPLPLSMLENNSFAGRLVKLDSVSFSASIRSYFAHHVAATRVFDPAVLRSAMADRRLPGSLVDKVGESAAIAGNEPLTFSVRIPLAYRVDVPRESYETLKDATAALLATGAQPQGPGKPVARDANLSGFAFDCLFPVDRETQVFSAVADLAPKTRIEPQIEEVSAPLSQLQSQGDTLIFAKPTAVEPLAWSKIVSVRTTANLTIPSDAYLLLESERPSAHYKSIIVTAFLIAFALVNLLAFRKRV